MILSRQVFEYQKHPILEKVTIRLPFRYEVIFPNEGCFLYVTGAQTKIFDASSIRSFNNQEAILLKCGTYFVDWISSVDSEQVEVIAFHLHPQALSALYHQGIPALLQKKLNTPSSHALVTDTVLSKFIENLEFYFQHPKLFNDEVLELKIKELILLLAQSTNAPSIQALFTDVFSPRHASISTTISTHLYSKLSIDEIARLCGMSLSTFKRAFEKNFHDTPNNYILNKRIIKAAELLRHTDKSIAEITYEIGFSDPTYFSRLFKKRTGHTPSSFRQNSISLNQ